MKFREHRGGLVDSINTTVEIDSTRKALVAHLINIRKDYPDPFSKVGTIEVLRYEAMDGAVRDPRARWEINYLVTENGNAIGFTDGPLTDELDDEAQLVEDAQVIGKAMIKAMRKMSTEQGRPLHHFIQGAIQALIAVNHVALDEDPTWVEFKNKIAPSDEEQ